MDRKPYVALLLYLLTWSLTSCTGNAEQDFGSYQVVRLDDDEHDRSLNRIFVVTSKDSVANVAFINEIVCALEEKYPVDSTSNASFFSEKKYADYKTKLFFDPGHTLPDSLYGKWLATFYFGEFEYGSRRYTLFPASMHADRKQVYPLKECR